MEPNYVDKKWEELTLKLNAIGKGPALTKQSWQKRFKDWKNAARAKYRKIMECKKATGGGTIEATGTLTPLEERGLEVWGKVAVTGTPLVDITGGISRTTVTTEVEHLSNDTNTTDVTSLLPNVESAIISDGDVIETITIVEDKQDNIESLPALPLPKMKSKKVKGIKPKIRPNLTETAEELKISYDQNTQILNNISNSFNLFIQEYKHKRKIEEKRLKFEIQKFKYEHKDFIFD